MSKEYWEHDREDLRFEEEGTPHWGDDTYERLGPHQETRQPTASSSLICPDTGQVTSHNSDDLRAQLTQARLDRESASSPITSKPPTTLASVPWGNVALDDELHGPGGEWLVVTEVSPDKRVITLECSYSGNSFKRDAGALRADIWERRLKVYRYWWDLPDEGEEYE
jgi:hypothetical protein